ncbi:hypothetical protein DPMN_094795 [Dreissena polymorpha]|uniref:Uncharacterized protein n=1 Tax=Dreissena polymorpha TaxID=45954 RepID=A0A9D4L5C3_DREPO|nr:hypothetical protein DPMN_094795 [Dreissena polymorpha]
MISVRDKNIKSIQDLYAQTSKYINTLRKNFEAIIDTIEKDTLKYVDNKMDELKETLKSDMANLSQLDVNMKRLNAAISVQTSKGNPLSFMMEMKYLDIMTTSESILDDLDEGSDTMITLKYNAEQHFVDQLQSFGKFSVSKIPSATSIFVDRIHCERHNIRMSHERVCDIRGICELSTGTLVIADRTNSSIKVLDNNYHVVNCMALSFPPNDICCISSTKVAVAMNSMTGGQIIIINVTAKDITVENTYEFKHKCTGITSTEYSMFVTTNTALLQYKMTAAMEFVKTIYEDTSSYLTGKCTLPKICICPLKRKV